MTRNSTEDCGGVRLPEKFQVIGLLGEGGMGRVLHAIHRDLDQHVAIKIVRPELAIMPELVERLLREARVAGRLRSDHVARVFDVGTIEGGAPFIVMEYLEGEDLASYLTRHGRIPADVTTHFVLQACEAIAEAHAAGIIHRDLKPENLFLTTNLDGRPRIKVLDFGVSKDLNHKSFGITGPGLVVGSPDFMSPEQLRADDVVDARTDIWSLGVVLYTLLTGSLPFDGEKLERVAYRVLHEDPAPLTSIEPTIPHALESVVLKCLRKAQEDRFSSVAELARALFAATPSGAGDIATRVGRIESVCAHRSDRAVPPELAFWRPELLAPAPRTEPRRLKVLILGDRSPTATATTRAAAIAFHAAPCDVLVSTYDCMALENPPKDAPDIIVLAFERAAKAAAAALARLQALPGGGRARTFVVTRRELEPALIRCFDVDEFVSSPTLVALLQAFERAIGDVPQAAELMRARESHRHRITLRSGRTGKLGARCG